MQVGCATGWGARRLAKGRCCCAFLEAALLTFKRLAGAAPCLPRLC